MLAHLKTAILLDIVQITSPPSPQFGQLVQLFSDVKIQDLNISSEQKYNMRNKVEKLKDEIMEKPNLQDPPCPPDQTR